jgi:putative transposase
MKRRTYEYRRYNHAVGLSAVHLVWIPKCRKKALVGKIRDRILEIFSELASEKDWNIRAPEVAPDHIHCRDSSNCCDIPSCKDFQGSFIQLFKKGISRTEKIALIWTSAPKEAPLGF